jgi:hypothetical protein
MARMTASSRRARLDHLEAAVPPPAPTSGPTIGDLFAATPDDQRQQVASDIMEFMEGPEGSRSAELAFTLWCWIQRVEHQAGGRTAECTDRASGGPQA